MKWIINIAVVLVVAWIVFYHNRSDGEATSTTDTIYIHDTMVVREPVAVENKPVGVKNYRIKLLGVIGKQNGKQNDSVEVELPIEQKVYSDSLYRAWVSGFDARLDSIYIYQPTRYITIKTTEQQSQWSWGVQAGLGITPKGLQPYIGLGTTFRF